MSRYRIIESVGTHVERVHSYADLEIHHPSKRGHERGRHYAEIDGRREEVLRAPTSQGHLMVSKDFVLTDEHGAMRVPVPSPTAGYVGRVDARAGLVAIYERPGGELIAQVRHMDLAGSGVHVGQTVAYGQPLGLQSGFGGGNPHAYGTHTHIDFNAARLDAFKQYFADVDSGRIALRPMPTAREDGHAGARRATAEHPTSGSSQHADVEVAQRALDHLGYTGADGRALAVDGRMVRHTRHALEQYQRDHALPATGRVDERTRVRLRADEATMASSTHPAHALYRQALGAVHALDAGMGVPHGRHSLALAGQAAVEAARAGLARIDRIELSRDGRRAQAVEFTGGIDAWATNRTSAPLDLSTALARTLEESSTQARQVVEAQATAAAREYSPARAPVR